VSKRDAQPSLLLTAITVTLVALAMVASLYWFPILLTRHPRPAHAEDILAAQNAVRTVCVAALLALGTAVTAVIAWRTYVLNRAGQYTDRYSKAVAQLGSEGDGVRLGGVYALEALARDSPSDAPAAVEVLAAFVRSHPADHSRPGGLLPLNDEREVSERAAQDLEAALRVLARTPRTYGDRPLDLRNCNLSLIEAPHAVLERAWLHRSDLSRAHLANARLNNIGLNLADLRLAVFDHSFMEGARMDRAQAAGASFVGVDLCKARLRNADLAAAVLIDAQLVDSDLMGAQLRGTRLDGADLQRASLRGANLTGAVLAGAKLAGADLAGARLTGARMTRESAQAEQLVDAVDADNVCWIA
jgi:uncharacterized protein YjbI with pentapeptide repeats